MVFGLGKSTVCLRVLEQVLENKLGMNSSWKSVLFALD